ncbi:centrosomal protein of 95 kDa [Biomphalaria glabrata]|nr:centrosomal protein of 95 kDa [Biomphalaria glabrata]
MGWNGKIIYRSSLTNCIRYSRLYRAYRKLEVMACLESFGPTSDLPTPRGVVNLANHLLAEFNIPTRLEDVSDISAALFVVLYESLFSDRLPGIVRQPFSKEDEIHNCQTVIDVLSSDVVHDNLSHIRGVDIIAGNLTSISNLLDIFQYLLEYVVNKIDSDLDNNFSRISAESDQSKFGKQDQNSLETSSEMSDKTKKKQTTSRSNKDSKTSLYKSNQHDGLQPASLNKNENRKAFDEHPVITHEEFFAMTYKKAPAYHLVRPPSPIKADQSESLLGQKTVDSEFDDTQKIHQSLNSFKRPTSPQIDQFLMKDYHTDMYSDSVSHQVPDKPFAASLTLNRPEMKRDSPELKLVKHTYASIPAKTTYDPVFSKSAYDPVSSKTTFNQVSTKSSFDPLATQMNNAIATKTTYDAVSDKAIYEHISSKTMFDPVLSTKATCDPVASTKTASASTYEPMSSKSLSDPFPSKTAPDLVSTKSSSDPVPTKVSYDPVSSSTYKPESLSGHYQPSAVNVEIPTAERDSTSKQHNYSYDDLRQMVEKTTALTRIALMTSPIRSKELDTFDKIKPTLPCSDEPLFSSNLKRDESKHVAFASYQSDTDREKKLVCKPSHHSKRPHSGLSTAKQMNKRYSSRVSASQKCKNKCKQGVTKSTKKQQANNFPSNRVYEATHQTLLKEDMAFKEKQDILQRFYAKDHEEFTEEVDDLIGREKQEVRKKEGELFKQFLKDNQKKRPEGKKVTSLSSKQAKMKSKSRKPQSQSIKQDSVEPVFNAETKEDLLPALLEEFPYLHLSDHTWHELWRRGLQQIEALTRSYQENLRKKTSAQNQLEDAADRHQLLGDLMRKQLEHTQRMHELKEQKLQQIKVKNKMHEKRMQSARARRYYNEYQVRARSKQLKKRTKEEMVFRDLFKTALNIQKERLKDIRHYANDCRKRQEIQRQNEIESLENFYQDQFQMLAERLDKERLDTGVREMAQQQMLERVKRELRKKMEAEIKLYQEQMFQDDDNVHFRQKDADRVKQHLHLARYTGKV